ncbi:MAG: 50S ribosomal protein L10 [Coriobacteriales bacterium]|jgi:large subunit ribosomal protein L10|nr:50S ribosomal protein L10 [Coriobacteriales bacterium]
MPNQEKVQLVEKIKADLEAADAIWVVDYRGLTVKDAEALRTQIRAQGAVLKVYKNSFTERALADLGYPALGEVLEGPSAFVFATGDPVASAKAIKSYAKSNPNLEIKGGLLDKAVLTAAQVKTLADMPSREELIAQVLGMLSGPLSAVVSALDAPTTIVRSLEAIEAKAA